MSKVTFITGNQNKFYEAQKICHDFGVELMQDQLDIDEIQHHDPVKITEAKARAAFALVGKPVVVNDSSWSIPALGGFPGGYMKDVASWLDEYDFLALMKDKKDQSILLTEVVAYYDGDQAKLIAFRRTGRFTDEPQGESTTAFNKVVVMDGEGMTIAEKLGTKDRSVEVQNYQHWVDFAKWYTNEETKA